MLSVRVKICGITSVEDAEFALSEGADYLGFNFFPRSRRYIDPESARQMLKELMSRGFEHNFGVGLFVNESADHIQSVMREVGLNIVQLSGDESPELISSLKEYTRIKSVKMTGADVTKHMESLGADYFLADTPHPTLAGGTGQSYDYSLAVEAARRFRLFLAGGLTPENVAGAIAQARPFAVDVATGVESSAGIKDPKKVRAFINAARSV